MNYIIPANTKKSQLFFGLFNGCDMILFGSGIGITLISLLTTLLYIRNEEKNESKK